MVVNPYHTYHSYSKESERANLDIYDDFKLKQEHAHSTIYSPPPLLNLKLFRPQGQIIDVKCKKLQ